METGKKADTWKKHKPLSNKVLSSSSLFNRQNKDVPHILYCILHKLYGYLNIICNT